MSRPLLSVLLLTFILLDPLFAFEGEKPAVRVRIGVDIRLGFQACMESWLPVADYLSNAIPGCRFVVVPLASPEDIAEALERDEVDFLVLDPAMEVLANDRYGAAPLLTITESPRDGGKPRSPTRACSGALIRRADRSDIQNVEDLRGKRLSAVKPWSLTGWLAQWRVLQSHGVEPQSDLKQVVFEGTNNKVVRSVLDGATDVGALDADMLLHLVACKQAPAASLCYFDQEGRPAPLTLGVSPSATDGYPGRVLSKADTVGDDLAQKVVDALKERSLDISMDQTPYQVGFSIACNYATVRRLLQALMGPRFAESAGFPLPKEYPVWLAPALVVAAALVVCALIVLLVRNRFRQREATLMEQIEDTRKELLEVRADRQRIDAILAMAGCGVDIVDDDDEIIYADAAIERKYGDWHGKKCHEYFCGSDVPCPGCQRPRPLAGNGRSTWDLECSKLATSDDPHARVHYIEGESVRIIGIPFRDEGGRWLYGRIHFPVTAFAASTHA